MEELVAITTRIPVQLRKQLREAAAREDIKLEELIRRLLEIGLRQLKRAA